MAGSPVAALVPEPLALPRPATMTPFTGWPVFESCTTPATSPPGICWQVGTTTWMLSSAHIDAAAAHVKWKRTSTSGFPAACGTGMLTATSVWYPPGTVFCCQTFCQVLPPSRLRSTFMENDGSLKSSSYASNVIFGAVIPARLNDGDTRLVSCGAWVGDIKTEATATPPDPPVGLFPKPSEPGTTKYQSELPLLSTLAQPSLAVVPVQPVKSW